MTTKTAEPTKEIGFADKFKAAIALAEKVQDIVIADVSAYRIAEGHLNSIRTAEKELEEEYRTHPVIIEAKRLQIIKGELARLLEERRKGLKNGPMLAYEQAEEEKRQAKERALAAEAKKKADEEAAAAAEIKRKEAAKAEAEAKRLQKKGDEEAAQAARDRAEAARIEQERIKKDAANAPAAVVVVPKTAPTQARRMVKKFVVVNADRVNRPYLAPDLVKIGAIVRSLGIPAETTVGGIKVWEEPA